MTATIIHGNNLDILPTFDDCSIDAIVTDPPYELGFMGKRWDASGIAYNITLWQECLRVLKPGGHLLAFGGTRTYHRMSCAIEDAGFEIRDSIHWLYGSGFPKSLDVSKAIDKQAGAERKVIGTAKRAQARSEGWNRPWMENQMQQAGSTVAEFDITAPATEQAKQWAGWGTALKPAHEPIVVARKPLTGTVASNVLEFGTGAINIDASRIGTHGENFVRPVNHTGLNEGWDRPWRTDPEALERERIKREQSAEKASTLGRWPANVILTHTEDCDDECVPGCPVALLDRQSGVRPGGNFPKGGKKSAASDSVYGAFNGTDQVARSMGDSGGASRFFYCAKPSRRERNAGLDHLDERESLIYSEKAQGPLPQQTPSKPSPRANYHPTVKPLALMRYLIRLVTPPGGTVLDPFAGSGTTLMAAILEGFNAIGIEMTDEYLPIIQGRIAWAEQQAANTPDQQELDL